VETAATVASRRFKSQKYALLCIILTLAGKVTILLAT
jgi:hypothetical protein